jgi:hypothetical protein
MIAAVLSKVKDEEDRALPSKSFISEGGAVD